MHVIEVSNVREALPRAVEYLMSHGVREHSRAGDVYSAPHPVSIVYHNPKQHVLLNNIRDANPFFHLMEAMWMLAGRRDGLFLDFYIKNFSREFGVYGMIPDAYGYRWRYGLRFDQLNEIVSQLHREPTTRQCVLQMWGAGDKSELLSHFAKPCNLVATFRIINNKLDMSVFNRSNDVIWGACGANAVHFPILQEYIAGRLGIEMGTYWQISTNLHLYERHIDMLLNRIGEMEADKSLASYLVDDNPYEVTQPLMSTPSTFDDDLKETMIWIDGIHEGKEFYTGNITNGFLSDTVIPMARSHQCYKNRETERAYQIIDTVVAEDWRIAGRQWLDRRTHE